MGSSYRQDLNSGSMSRWETKLRTAIALIDEVIEEVSENIGSDGQYDNAADDGALCEKLGIAKRFIKEELPKAKEDKTMTEHKNCPCCGGEGIQQTVELDDRIEEYQVIRCVKCGLQTKWCESESEAWEMWDTRPTTTVRVKKYNTYGTEHEAKLTACCNIPISNRDNFCPNCGKEIIRL